MAVDSVNNITDHETEGRDVSPKEMPLRKESIIGLSSP